MPILKRADGIQFVIHAYRELLQPAKASLLRSEIRMLAQNHGEYVRLFKLSSGEIEAVFSRDPGFLLGEAVWQYFGKPADLIYCEALSEINVAALVIVRSGSVYVDSKISFANIQDELASIVMGDNQYAVYLYGDVPISQSKQRGKFVIDATQMTSFTLLEKPLFPVLPVNEDLQLQPLEFALRSDVIGRAIPWRWVFIGASVVILGFAVYYWATTRTPPPKVQPLVPVAAPVDPYLSYKNALRTPAPEKQLAELAAVMNTVYLLPGWQVSSVTFQNGKYTISVTSVGGSMMVLNQWARNHGMRMMLSAAQVSLSLTTRLLSRAAPQTIYTLRPLVYYLIDRINQILPQRGITLGDINHYDNYKTANLALQLTNVAPSVLALIGRQFINLPVKITKIQVTPGKGGLLSGMVGITVLGN